MFFSFFAFLYFFFVCYKDSDKEISGGETNEWKSLIVSAMDMIFVHLATIAVKTHDDRFRREFGGRGRRRRHLDGR